ncbi:MAG: response regulator, partial [Candidatus Scalindua sp.]|nr:response regulator [Candidatus Scalindua sp.]
YPRYFKALNESRAIAADDACNDPRTNEFSIKHLKPFGITSILDVPIRLRGQIVGIVCHDHTGSMREWTKEEEDFAASIADMVSLAMEANEQQKMEESLLQSEKLKAMGVITAGIAHEFNNILAVISGNIQLIDRRYKSDNKLTDMLKIIKMATNDGAQISGRMLKFAKTKKDTVGFVPCDIRDLIKNAIEFTMPRWKNMAQANGINYRIEKKGMRDVPPILCNPTELREIFINIINNALDAMPGDGGISFSTWSTEDNIVFISITDTGKGISEEVKKYIFDPFFTTKLPVGSGLGMSTVYGIITRHGGKIEVESKLGKGTIFTLQFPTAAKMDNIEVNSEPVQSTQCKILHILVVDDEINVGKLLDEYLSDYGHNVITVDNGADAIKLSKRESFDLVLCDLAMPIVSGYDVIRALNKLDKCPKIGIITGWDENLILLKEKNLKVDFLITKPFDLPELTRHISDLKFKD